MVIGIEAAKANVPNKTGTEWYAHTLIRHIVSIDRTVDFVLYSNAPLQASLTNLGSNVRERLLRWPPRYLWHQIRLSLALSRRPPDVFYAPAHTIPLIHPRATYTMIHDIGFSRLPDLYSSKEQLYNQWAARYALAHAAGILVPSLFTKNEILERYPEARRRESSMFVVHHGFESGQPPAGSGVSDNLILERYGIRQPFLLSIGRLQEKKNTPRLVQAFGKLVQRVREPVLLVLAGSPDFGFGRIQTLIRENKLEQRVILPGYVKQDDLSALLRAATAFVFPSLYEGFGFPVLEAQLQGTPVLASNTGSLPEIGGKGALYADPTSTEELAVGMERLLNDERLRRSLRQEGRQNIGRFSWRACAAATLNILRNRATPMLPKP